MYNPEPGMLLIAEPFLKDPNFTRSVVLLCEHKPEGSFGLVLNRKTKHTLEDLIPELVGMKNVVNDGGPVQRDTLHFIHQFLGQEGWHACADCGDRGSLWCDLQCLF